MMYCSIAQYNFASSEKIYPTMIVQYPYCVLMNTDTTCTDNDVSPQNALGLELPQC